MARVPRKTQQSPYYHILVEGSSFQDIFQEPSDKDKMLEILARVLDESKVTLYAYCIMENHAHFIVREGLGDISQFMKRVNGAYASYYNRKYREKGQVFYDRFKSEAIQTMEQLLRVIRFVHNNPILGGFVEQPCAYPWSSYAKYVESGDHPCFIQREHVWMWFGKDPNAALQKFVWFMREKNADLYLDLDESIEKKVKFMIDSYLSSNQIKLKDLGYKENTLHRDHLIRWIRTTGGLSIRKIAELLQLNRGTVFNVLSRSAEGEEERKD